MKKQYDKIVFCDFDGTITTEDAFVHVCTHFAPEKADLFLKKVLEGSITLREGIRMIVESINSSQYPKMLDYVNNSTIRPGLSELIDYLDDKNVPFIVVSGGLKGLVSRQLGSIEKRVEAVYAADVEANNNYLKVVSDFEDGPELVNKTQVMHQYNYKEAVAIGDGITDHNMALEASVVFARKHLADYLEKEKQPFHTWEDFHDILRELRSLWG